MRACRAGGGPCATWRPMFAAGVAALQGLLVLLAAAHVSLPPVVPDRTCRKRSVLPGSWAQQLVPRPEVMCTLEK